MLESAPSPILALVAHLRWRGYEVREQRDDAAFGNRVAVLTRAPVAVRIVRDRGQWWVEAQSVSWTDWFDPDVFRSCLDAVDIAIEPREMNTQIQYLISVLDRITETVSDSERAEELHACVREKSEARTRARLGF